MLLDISFEGYVGCGLYSHPAGAKQRVKGQSGGAPERGRGTAGKVKRVEVRSGFGAGRKGGGRLLMAARAGSISSPQVARNRLIQNIKKSGAKSI